MVFLPVAQHGHCHQPLGSPNPPVGSSKWGITLLGKLSLLTPALCNLGLGGSITSTLVSNHIHGAPSTFYHTALFALSCMYSVGYLHLDELL